MQRETLASILPSRGRDQTGSHDRVPVVDRRELTLGDTVRGLLEVGDEACGNALDARGDGLGAVAKLHLSVVGGDV